MPDIFDELETDTAPKKDIFDELVETPSVEPVPATTATSGAYGTRFRPSVRTNILGGPNVPPTESLLGISPDIIPSGANTKAPWLTIPLSVAGKTAAGVAGYITSPQGATETALAATPAAPAVLAKWAYDMVRGGYQSTKAIVDELGQMANEAVNKGIISANQLGPVPEGKTQQDHIQSIAENAVNAAVMAAGGVASGLHAIGKAKAVLGRAPETPPIAPEPTLEPPVEPKAPEVAPVVTEAPQVKPEAVAPAAAPAVFDAAVPPVKEPLGPGMGGALKEGEIPETGAGGEKYGVAERVRAERAQAGQVEPAEPGKGMSTQQTIEMGREIVRRDPEAPERIMTQFESDPKRGISTEGMAVARAHGESLAAGARTIEENYGTESPEYQAAKEYLSDWDKRSKAMQTEWHKQGQAQQGETDIDTGSFTGLERARKESTGKDIPAPQRPRAKRIASENKQAQEAVSKATDLINKYILRKKATDPEQAALDAANKTVREAAVRVADAENNARVAQAQRDKDMANVQVKEAQKALRAAQDVEQKAKDRALKETQRRAADPSIAVWELARKYLEENKGLYDFNDLRNKIAADLKMSPSMVSHWLSRDATMKRMADDLWNKQRNARRLKEQAKNWLRELDTPGYLKALNSIPRGMFGLSVFGHGFVALGTHAPIVAFQPKFWGAYVNNFGKMYKMVFSPAYYEAQMQDLVRRPNYELARRSGLQNDPFKYEEYHTTAIRDLVKSWIGEKGMDRVDKLTSGGNRGYGVLKLLRQDMFDQRYDNLPRSIRIQGGVSDAIADGVNHATGVTAKGAPKGANIALFAPRLAGSRVMWLLGDPARATAAILDWKKTTEAERQFAKDQMKEKAWVFGTFASLLAMNQGFLSATGSDQKINGIPEFMGGAGFDPLASDFMKFKVAGANVAYGGALLTMAKLPARVAVSILYEGKGSKFVLEDERVSKVIGAYLRSQASPFAGTVADLALGRDYEERPLPAKMFGTVEQEGKVPKRLRKEGIEPYTWPEWAATKLPIPVAEGIKEGLKGAGMNDEQAKYWMKAWAITSLMTATGTRITEDTREE